MNNFRIVLFCNVVLYLYHNRCFNQTETNCMKTLYLVRHAKSSWKDMSLHDRDRPLNKRGSRDAPFMGALMHKKGIVPDLLMTSPAKRASTTAKAFADALGYPQNEIVVNPTIYEATVTDLLETIQALDSTKNAVMLFGHNFTYTLFANYYAKPPLDNVPTAAVVAIEFKVTNWKEVTLQNGKLVFFEYPRKYFPKST